MPSAPGCWSSSSASATKELLAFVADEVTRGFAGSGDCPAEHRADLLGSGVFVEHGEAHHAAGEVVGSQR